MSSPGVFDMPDKVCKLQPNKLSKAKIKQNEREREETDEVFLMFKEQLRLDPVL